VRKDIQYSQFQNYELTYAHFVRFPTPFSWGNGQPGSSPGNKWILFSNLRSLWCDAKVDLSLFSQMFLEHTQFNAASLCCFDACASTIHNVSSITLFTNTNSNTNIMHVIVCQDLYTNNTSIDSACSYFNLYNANKITPSFSNRRKCKKNNTKIQCKKIGKFPGIANSHQKGSKKHVVNQYSNKKNKNQCYRESNYLHNQKILHEEIFNILLNLKQVIFCQIKIKLIASRWRKKISWDIFKENSLRIQISHFRQFYPHLLYICHVLIYLFALCLNTRKKSSLRWVL
jgi:hypothetical protein